MRTIVSRFTSCVIAAAVLIASTPNVSAQEKTTDHSDLAPVQQYSVETILCSVQPGLTFGDLEAMEYTRTANYERKSERERKKARERVEEVLKKEISYKSGVGGLHIRSFLEQVEGIYGLALVVDGRVVPLRGDNLRIRSDADLLQGKSGSADFVTDGIVQDMNIHKLTVEQALQLVLKQVNLDYRIEDGFIWITSPEKLKAETFNDFRADLDREHLLLRTDGSLTFFDWQQIPLGESDDVERHVRKLDQYEKFDVLARPNIMTTADRPATLNITTEFPYEHLTPADFGNDATAFVSETKYEEVGTIISMTVRENPTGGLLFDCSAKSSILAGREPVSGTDLPVGKPSIIKVEREIQNAHVPEDQWFAMLMNTPQDYILLMLTRIVEIPKRDSAAAADPEIVITSRWHQALGHFTDDESPPGEGRVEFEAVDGNVRVLPIPNGSETIDDILGFRAVESLEISRPNSRVTLPSRWKEIIEQRKSQTITKVVLNEQSKRRSRKLDLEGMLTRLTPPDRQPVITVEGIGSYTFMIEVDHHMLPYKFRTERGLVDSRDMLADTGLLLAISEKEDSSAELYKFNVALEIRRPKLVRPRTVFDSKADAEASLLYGRGQLVLAAEPGQNYAVILPLEDNEYIICTFLAEPYRGSPSVPQRRGGRGGAGGQGGSAAKPANH